MLEEDDRVEPRRLNLTNGAHAATESGNEEHQTGLSNLRPGI